MALTKKAKRKTKRRGAKGEGCSDAENRDPASATHHSKLRSLENDPTFARQIQEELAQSAKAQRQRQPRAAQNVLRLLNRFGKNDDKILLQRKQYIQEAVLRGNQEFQVDANRFQMQEELLAAPTDALSLAPGDSPDEAARALSAPSSQRDSADLLLRKRVQINEFVVHSTYEVQRSNARQEEAEVQQILSQNQLLLSKQPSKSILRVLVSKK